MFWSIVLVRRGLGWAANRTYLSIFVWQLLSAIALFAWSEATRRPDLVRLPGLVAFALVAFVVPIAIGSLLDGLRVRPVRIGLTVATSVVMLATLGISAVAVATAIAPAMSSATIAGRQIPITADTLQNGYSMSVHIPPTVSGFSARNASLWVPPGWILHPDVRRSIVETMMGQPGVPSLGVTLNALHGLGHNAVQTAPFVLVVDQLGGRNLNPPCRDTVAGKVTTYLSVDVPRWIRATLPVSQPRRYWTVAGYSDGGDCAEFLAATFPSIWSNLISISGPNEPGTPHVAFAITHYFGGSHAAFDAALTATALKNHGRYSDMYATFATGALDTKYGPGVIEIASLADEANWHVSTLVVSNSTHVGPVVNAGFEFGYRTLLSAGRLPTEGDSSARVLCTAQQLPEICGAHQGATLAGVIAIIDLGLVLALLLVQVLLRGRVRDLSPR